MGVANLPRKCGVAGVVKALEEASALQDGWAALVFHVPSKGRLDSGAVATLATWGLLQRAAGKRLRFTGEPSDLAELDVLGLRALVEVGNGGRRPAGAPGAAIPVRSIASSADVSPATEAVNELVLRSLQQPGGLHQAVEWIVAELLDNVVQHADSPVPGVLAAHHRRGQKRLDIAVVDSGRGILASLSESMSLFSHGDAITQALKRGVTRNSEVGQGNGLAGALEILRRNGGEFQLWSGDAVFHCAQGREWFDVMPAMAGTGVCLSLDTTRAVALEDTWIAATRSQSYLRSWAERVDAGVPLNVRQEFPDTRTRSSGKDLRTKARTLLTAASGELVLDFEGVRAASSSFLDEALGRLAADLGPDLFRQRVRIRNLPSVLQGQADAVIAQRLELEP